MKLLITNKKESRDVLAYFGKFHDAYIHAFTFRSHYETTSAGENLFPGFDIIITFAHSGYAAYNPPTRKVRAEFLNVSCLNFEVKSVQSSELLISEVQINSCSNSTFEFQIEFNEFDDTERPNLRFRFERAIVTEGSE